MVKALDVTDSCLGENQPMRSTTPRPSHREHRLDRGLLVVSATRDGLHRRRIKKTVLDDRKSH
jgi:hypothetical protein